MRRVTKSLSRGPRFGAADQSGDIDQQQRAGFGLGHALSFLSSLLFSDYAAMLRADAHAVDYVAGNANDRDGYRP